MAGLLSSYRQSHPPLPRPRLAASRSRFSWNACFEHWERPASTTEEDQIQRSAAMVRRALSSNPWLTREGVQVRPQGSYHNNTNVRQDSDMDLCALHPGLKVDVEPSLFWTQAVQSLGYSFASGPSIPEIAAALRFETARALRAAFGEDNVKEGTKAFRVSAVPGSRADADVVPAVRLHHVRRRDHGSGPSTKPFECHEGVIIYATDGTLIRNFPRQHHANGKAKRERTRRRFKRVVRTAKRLRDELVDLGRLRTGQVPSFLVESVVYLAEDSVFLFEDDRYDRMRRLLYHLGERFSDPLWASLAVEINGVKPLFHESQPWTIANACTFVSEALWRLES